MWPLLLLLLVPEDVAPSGGSRSFSASGSQSSGGSAPRPNECTFCHATDHRLLTCPIRVCKICRQRGPGHYRSDCPNNPTRRDTRPQSTAATASVSSTASASPTLIDVSDLPALVQQIMSASGNPSTALSASTDPARTGQTLGIGRRHGRLFQLIHLHLPISTAAATSTSSSSPSFAIWHSRLDTLFFHSSPTYLTNPSIDLFPEDVDVDVPADPPDDTIHMAPPPIVYPVESSSTDPALQLCLLFLYLVTFLSVVPLGSTICDLGFSASAYDSALFTHQSAHGIVLLLLYVDDMIITGDDVHVSSGSTGYSLTQTKYASDLLTRAGLSDCKTASTPLDANARLNSLDGDLLSDATLYRQLVGSLIYLTVTRPDIAHAVHLLVSQFMSAPRSTHYAAVLRILRYVKGTLFHGLHFSSQSSLQLYAYSDADWAGDPTDRRSTTGFCFFLGDSLISWRSKKQTLVASSSTEAEYRALADTTQELLWLRWLLQDMGVSHSGATHVVRGTVHLLPVSSADQTADIFTKSLLPGRFDALVTKLKLVSAKPP
ncbi:hypothetical protein Acr_10g0007470 [Actinidia rufa]|uniref:Reverse transcriptase Ty1/copia-type domain-containing protein n=1 Tax=Actinidia rufa TaxID=165716 RepID=A0A7J0F9I4_9ERIC|nr:hypothetical protein Acr_10g0007470 [Actinidia rufa]